MFTLLDLALTDERYVFMSLRLDDESQARVAFSEWVASAKIHGGRIELRRGSEYGEVIASYSGFAETE